jgi:hypothetical protein
MGAVEKQMQEAIGSGTWRGRFTPEEILDYCEGYVEALTRLLLAMLPGINLPRALLLRGRFMAAAAAMKHAGVPIDKEMLARLRRYWADIQDELIARSTRTTACSTAAPFASNTGSVGWPPTEFPGPD